MAKKLILFMVGYFLWIGLIMTVGMNFLNDYLVDKPAMFDSTSGPIITIVGALIVFGAPVIIFLYFFYRTPKWEKDLQETGKLASALVLEVKYTGVSTGSRYNSTPWLRVKLQVQPDGDTPFEVVMEKPSTKLFMIRTGVTVNVKYDPNNKKHVVLAEQSGQFGGNSAYSFDVQPPTVINLQDGAIPSDLAQMISNVLQQAGQSGTVTANGQGFSTNNASGVNLIQQLTELSAMHQRGELTDDEFAAAKKKLLAQLTQ